MHYQLITVIMNFQILSIQRILTALPDKSYTHTKKMPARSFDEAPVFEGTLPGSNNVGDNMTTESSPIVLNNIPVEHEEVVVSGVSCRLPQSDNMEEFKENLMGGVDMVTEDDLRWKTGMYGLPKRNGKLKDLSKFDAAFFGVHPKQANSMDPQLRMLLEVTYEAITDAGVNPETVRGSKTGVFIGASASESHDAWSMEVETTVGYAMTGCTRSVFANRLSRLFLKSLSNIHDHFKNCS